MCRVRESREGAEKRGCRNVGPKERQRLGRKGRYLERYGICLLLEKMMKADGTGETGLSQETRYRRMLADLFKVKAFKFLAECVKEYDSVEGRHVYDGNIRMTLVELVFVGGMFFLL